MTLRRRNVGPDKRFFEIHQFLKRDWGFGATAQPRGTRERLNGAYFVCGRSLLALKAASRSTCSVDFILGDCSRVAKLEVMLIHLFSYGTYVALPLKVQPDHGLGLSAAAVAEAAAASGDMVTKKARTNPVKRARPP